MDNYVRVAGERFLPKVADAIFSVDGIIAYVAKANTASSVTITMNKNEKRGGVNNAVIGVIYSDTAVEASFTAGSWQPEFLAAHIGSVIQLGKFGFYIDELKLPITDGKITLPGIPMDKQIQVYAHGSYVSLPAETTEIDVSQLNIEDCAKVMALYEQNGKRINITSETTPMVGRLVLRTPLYEGTRGEIGTSEYVFPAFQMDGNWTHNFGSDATYELKGSAIAVDSDVCGEGQTYGYYQEYVKDEEEIMSFSAILAAPSVMELSLAESDTDTITVYGTKGGTYAKTLIESGVTFTSDKSDIATVSTEGLVTPVAEGEAVISCLYNGLKATVDVTVTA